MWNFAEQLVQDVRYAGRMIGANRLFTAMAVLSLALGIGANTAIYSFMDAILLRALPVERPEELVVFNWTAKGNPAVIHGQNGSRFGDRKTRHRHQPQLSIRLLRISGREARPVCRLCSRTPTRGKSISSRGDRRKSRADFSYRADFTAGWAWRRRRDA